MTTQRSGVCARRRTRCLLLSLVLLCWAASAFSFPTGSVRPCFLVESVAKSLLPAKPAPPRRSPSPVETSATEARPKPRVVLPKTTLAIATLPALRPSAQDAGRAALKWLLRDARQIQGGPPGVPFPINVKPSPGGAAVTYKQAF